MTIVVAVDSIIASTYEAADGGSSGLGQVLNDVAPLLQKKMTENHFPDKITVRWSFGE